MLRNLTLLVALIGAALLNSACYSTQEGRVRAGVPFVKDNVTSRYQLPMETVHAAARQVLESHGVLTGDDSVKKLLTGTVDGSKIWISFDDSDPTITQITIQARASAGRADVEIASEIDKLVYGELIRQ